MFRNILSKFSRGFTIIELIVSISIIGILASIVIVTYSGWQTSVVTTELKSDLNGASIAMENYRTFNNVYPTSVPATFASSPEVTIAVGAVDGGLSYCLNSVSSRLPGLRYYLDSSISNQASQVGSCTLPAAPTLVATTASSSSVDLSWSAVSGATNYIVQRDTDSGFATATQIASQIGRTFTSSGLSSGVVYYYRVNATTTTSTTDWSTSAFATTTISAPSAPVVAAATVTNTTTWSWPAVTCAAGTTASYYYVYSTSYGYNSGTVGPQTGVSVAFTTSSEGYTYTVSVQARCYKGAVTSDPSASGSDSYYRAITQSLVLAVTLNGANVLATANAFTCALGTAEYQFKSSLDGGSYGSYSSWSATATSTQTANDGVEYAYIAQARCNYSGTYSDIATSIEYKYTDPIPTPTMTTVSQVTSASTTTWSWSAVTCTSGNTVSYGYDYTISPSGYDSGFVSPQSATSVAFTTSVGLQTYAVAVQARCTHNAVPARTSSWSTASSASYYRPKYTLIISAGTGGSVNTAVNLDYDYNTSVTITATASSSSFASWTGAGCPAGSSGSVSMTTNITCVANFACTLATVAGTGGTVSAGGTNACGTTVTVTATAVSSAFAAWSGGTGCSGTASHTFALNANTTCTARFNCTLTTAAGSGGTVSAGTTVTCGTAVTVTATPNASYVFSSWSGGTGCSGIASHNFALNANTTCTAAFVLNDCVLTTAAGTGGTVSAGGTYACGSTQTITATANPGYTFSTWSGTNCGTTPASHTITMSTTTCTASFTINSYTLTVTGGTGGGTYTYGSTPTITASPAANYHWTSWTASGGSCPGASSGTVTVNGTMTCTSNTTADTYALTTSIAWAATSTGTTGGGSFAWNSTPTITATAATGYKLIVWDRNIGTTGTCPAPGVPSGQVYTGTVTMGVGAMNCRANFIYNAVRPASMTATYWGTPYIYTLSWAPSTCPANVGETIQYQYYDNVTGVWYSTTATSVSQAWSGVYAVTASVQARCKTTGTNGAWSSSRSTASFTTHY